MNLLNILADLPMPPANEFSSVLWSIVALMTITALGLGIAVKIKELRAKSEGGMPQPLRVQGETRYATHEEMESVRLRCETCRADFQKLVSDIFAKMDANYRELIKSGSDRASGLHKRLDDITRGLGAVEGELRRTK